MGAIMHIISEKTVAAHAAENRSRFCFTVSDSESSETSNLTSELSSSPEPKVRLAPMTQRSVRKGLLSEERCVAFRTKTLVGKEIKGTVTYINKKYFISWSSRRMDAVFLHWRVLRDGIGLNESMWQGQQVKCTISGLGPGCVSAYQMHPSTQKIELTTGVKPKLYWNKGEMHRTPSRPALKPRFGGFQRTSSSTNSSGRSSSPTTSRADRSMTWRRR